MLTIYHFWFFDPRKINPLFSFMVIVAFRSSAFKLSWILNRGGSRGRVQGVRIPPPSPEMKPSSSYSLLKFVYLTGQWRHSLEVHPLLRKILITPSSEIFRRFPNTFRRCQCLDNNEDDRTFYYFEQVCQQSLLIKKKSLERSHLGPVESSILRSWSECWLAWLFWR